MEDIRKDWRSVYAHLTELKPPLKAQVLDTVVLDILSTRRPLSWISTNSQGFVVAKDLRSLSLPEVLQQLAQLVTAPDPKKRYFPQAERPNPIAVAITRDQRLVQTYQSLFSVGRSYSKDLEGLTVLYHLGKQFDPRVFIYEVTEMEGGFDDAVRVRPRDVMENTAEEDVVERVRLACSPVIEKLQVTTRLRLKSFRALYRFELGEKQPWLLGVEECIMRRKSDDSRLQMTLNVVSLHIEKRPSSQLSNTFIIEPRQDDFPVSRTSFPRFLSRPLFKSCVNSSLLGPSRQVLNNRLKRRILSQTRAQKRRKLKEMWSNQTGEACSGQFCAYQGLQYAQFQPFNHRSRFKVSSEWIEIAKKQEFSPLHNPKLLLLPEKMHKMGHKRVFSEGKEGETGSVSSVNVCLRCYFIYSNVAKAYEGKG